MSVGLINILALLDSQYKIFLQVSHNNWFIMKDEACWEGISFIFSMEICQLSESLVSK